jgi:predicted nucleotidyltransferase
MKQNSNISYDALQAPGLKKILEQVGEVCHTLGVDFFMVGAIARNAWLVAHQERARGTRDIDFAVCIPDVSSYNKLREILITEYGYQASAENAFCLLSAEGSQVDLLPFGAIEAENRVLIAGKGLTTIGLDGFKEVYEQGLETVMLGEESYAICNIPSILILKLIAYDDRPEHRIKDVKDIAVILHYYPQLEEEHIWSNFLDLYDDEKSHQEVAMIGLGREMLYIAQSNGKLLERLSIILQKGIAGESRLADHMIQNSLTERAEAMQYTLQLLLQGLTTGK